MQHRFLHRFLGRLTDQFAGFGQTTEEDDGLGRREGNEIGQGPSQNASRVAESLARDVVALKAEVEKIREQVQNIE